MAAEIEAALLRFKQALGRRHRSTVNDAARDLLALQAPLGNQWQSISAALQHNGEWNLAIAAIEEMARYLQQDRNSRYALANVLYQAGRLTEASAILDDLVERGWGPRSVPDTVAFLNSRASIALLLGDIENARLTLEQALRLDPRSGQAWLSFSEVADFGGPDSSYAGKLEAAFAEGASLAAEGTKLAHATGRLRHQLKDYACAFDAFVRGAELFEPHRSDRRSGSATDLAMQSASFTPEFIRSVADRVHVPHGRVIFVSGLPRSGTTLVEQILASHPEVQHGEELSLFRILGQEIGALDAASFSAWLDRGGDPNDLVELYLHLASERFGPEGRFVDKTVEAGNYMGLLLALFPNAPIFWLRRDPIDNGWSAFRTTFARGATWSWDLQDIGRRLAQEDSMIAYWSQAGQERIHFIDYEALVRDPEGHIPRIAAAAGLTLEDGMLRPHETQRTVATASVSQVREPINLKGLGVAEPYRPWLSPMIDAYAEASVTKGSSARG